MKITRRTCHNSRTWTLWESSHRLSIFYFINPSLGCRHRVSSILPFRALRFTPNLPYCFFFSPLKFLLVLLSPRLKFPTSPYLKISMSAHYVIFIIFNCSTTMSRPKVVLFGPRVGCCLIEFGCLKCQ